MNTTLFDRIVASAEANDKAAITTLIKLALRTDSIGEMARTALAKLGVEVQHATA